MKLRYWWLMGVAMLATDAMADVVSLEQAVDRALRHDCVNGAEAGAQSHLKRIDTARVLACIGA